MRMKTVARIAGFSIGSVIMRKIWNRLAPSICACSNGSFGRRGKRGQQRERDQRRPVPDIHDHGGGEGLVGEAAEAKVDAEPFVEIVGQRPEPGDGEEPPGRADGDRRHHQGQGVDGAEEALQAGSRA